MDKYQEVKTMLILKGYTVVYDSQLGDIQQKIELETIGRSMLRVRREGVDRAQRTIKLLHIILLSDTCHHMFGKIKGTCHTNSVP